MMTQLSVTQESFRLAEVFTISRGSRTEAKVVTVRASDGEAQGWGECVPYARYGESLDSVAAQIAALPEDITRATLQEALEPGAARNAVDCALWDLEAKAAGKRPNRRGSCLCSNGPLVNLERWSSMRQQ